MDNLTSVKNKIIDFLNDLGDDYILTLFDKLPSGKMLRSKLIFKIAGVNEQSVKLCAVIELIHAASLLHDDVLDDATTRRGVKSINALYGNKIAIMFGDILYSKGFFELTSFDDKISKTVSNAVTKLSIGEMQEIDLTKEFNEDIDKYFDIIYKKTASLIEASAKSAAILDNKNSDKYAIFGKNLGIAFQLIDDILDITSDSKTLGKPAMQDFYEGKVTLPYLLLYKDSDIDTKLKLKSFFKKQLNQEELEWLKNKLYDSGVIDESIKIAKQYGLKGIEAIKDENKDLVDIMEDMINRKF